jgi:hypothetical protein
MSDPSWLSQRSTSYTRVCDTPTNRERRTNTPSGVNGSQPELTATMRPYELNSSLNDEEGVWLASHGFNRYREWDELRYSLRSVEKYAQSFINRIQILVNAFEEPLRNGSLVVRMGKQRPHWLSDGNQRVQVLSQEEFFGPEERNCLPTFNSLTIENQLYNTESETDRVRWSTQCYYVLMLQCDSSLRCPMT